MTKDLFGNDIQEDALLRDKFLEPPFSVLDTKSGSWQNRKRAWLAKGIKSETGRDAKAFTTKTDGNKYDYMPDMKSNTSIFDPALCELMYHWFCPTGGGILDPFAGGSVRGIVAHYLGYKYTGIELRAEQVMANIENAGEILPIENRPTWHIGDSDAVLDSVDGLFDFVFSCPPYLDLEIYSNDKNDLSNMDVDAFSRKYNSIIKKACKRLKAGGFGVFVIGDVRDKKTGFYKDFISITKMAFACAGMGLYNDIILLDPIGTAMLRANGTFVKGGGKVVKVHQNILVFKKR